MIINVNYSDEDKCYVANVLGTYISCHGETEVDAMKEIIVVLDDIADEEDDE